MKYFNIKIFIKGTFLFSDLHHESLGIKIWDTSILKPLIRAHFYDLHYESHIQKKNWSKAESIKELLMFH